MRPWPLTRLFFTLLGLSSLSGCIWGLLQSAKSLDPGAVNIQLKASTLSFNQEGINNFVGAPLNVQSLGSQLQHRCDRKVQFVDKPRLQMLLF